MQQKLPVILIAFGFLLLGGFAIIEWGMLPMFLGDKVVQGMRMFYGATGAGEHWKRFGLPSFAVLDPTLIFIYFYNVTNADDIIHSGIKPILQEVGPYVYTVEVITEPENNTFIDNETIFFRERKIYHFNPSLSGNLSENDEINILNIPFLKVVEAIDNLPKDKSILGSLLLPRSDQHQLLFIQHPVRDLLFTGFTQPSLEKAQKFVERNSSPFLPDDKFAFFYGQNGSLSKLFHVSTALVPKRIGKKIKDYSQIIEYDGKSEMDSWAKTEDNQCNQIDGTSDGMIFDPVAIRKNLKVSIFRPEMCRSLNLRMNGHVENHHGLHGYRFILPPELLQDSSVNFENNCLCPSPEEVQKFVGSSCVKPGTISNCRDGFPFITSLPHFLDSQGQPHLTQVVGLSPNREKHGSFVDMEPVTGLALKSSMKFQLNYEVKPSGSHDDMKKVPPVLFPLLWTDEVKSMHFILSKGIQEKVMAPVKFMEISKWPIFALGSILLAAGIIIYIVRARKKNYPV